MQFRLSKFKSPVLLHLVYLEEKSNMSQIRSVKEAMSQIVQLEVDVILLFTGKHHWPLLLKEVPQSYMSVIFAEEAINNDDKNNYNHIQIYNHHHHYHHRNHIITLIIITIIIIIIIIITIIIIIIIVTTIVLMTIVFILFLLSSPFLSSSSCSFSSSH